MERKTAKQMREELHQLEDFYSDAFFTVMSVIFLGFIAFMGAMIWFGIQEVQEKGMRSGLLAVFVLGPIMISACLKALWDHWRVVFRRLFTR